MRERLFDPNVTRSNEIAATGETVIDFLERSSWASSAAVRALLERWVAEYPASDRGKLHCRLRAERAKTYRGAWWKLYLTRLVAALGFVVEEIEPEISGQTRRPDLRLAADLQSTDETHVKYRDAMLRCDFSAASGCVADPFVLRLRGRTASHSAASVRRGGRAASVLYPWRRSTTVIATALDPKDHDIVWSHTHDEAHGLPGLGQLNASLVVRYRYDGGRIEETTYAPPLAG